MSAHTPQDACTSAQTALTTSPIWDLRSLQVKRHGNTLFLSGRVNSFYHKQLAQEVVRSITEELNVVNSVDVEQH